MNPARKSQTAAGVRAAGVIDPIAVPRLNAGRRLARKVLQAEAVAIAALVERIDERFDRAIEILYQCKGRVVTTGVGKSGIVGRKIAATLASTGTSAFFLHPTEAAHGDIGAIQADDVVLALSSSGESEEVFLFVSAARRIGASIVAITGNPVSAIARAADATLDCQVAQEACPFNLVP